MEQGGTLNKVIISHNVLQKSIDYAHANSSDLKNRIVSVKKENSRLISQNEQLSSQARDMSRRLDNSEQQLAQSEQKTKCSYFGGC